MAEYNHDREEFAKKEGEAAEFEAEGGVGFSPLRWPRHECPESSGDGQARVVIMDTRDLASEINERVLRLERIAARERKPHETLEKHTRADNREASSCALADIN